MKPYLAALVAAFLCLPLILAPALAVNTKPDASAQADLVAKCEAGGGCFVITEEDFKKALVIAFEEGQRGGGQVGYQFGLKACKGST